jgi:hypothetical protein
MMIYRSLSDSGGEKRLFGRSAEPFEGKFGLQCGRVVPLRPAAQEFHRSPSPRVTRTFSCIVPRHSSLQVIRDAAVERTIAAKKDVQAPLFHGPGFGG